MTDNPNAPNKYGETPIHVAARNGHTEIVKILVSLTDNPNAPTNNGDTPIDVAITEEICQILKSFNTSRKRKDGPSQTSMKRVKKS